MSNVNSRRSIRNSRKPTFDEAWVNGECWFANTPQPSFYETLIEVFETLYPDQMALAREEIRGENFDPTRRTP
jgi:hypothetical protein